MNVDSDKTGKFMYCKITLFLCAKGRRSSTDAKIFTFLLLLKIYDCQKKL